MPRVVPEYKEEARNRILDGALQVFSEKGFHKTTMDDIAEKLGVSKGTLYLYFKSKDELFKGICESEPQSLNKIIRTSYGPGDPIESSRNFFDAALKQYATNVGLGFEILAEASRDPTLRRVLKDNYDNDLKVIEDFVRELKEKGFVPKDLDTRSLGEAMISLWVGLKSFLLIGYPVSEARKVWVETTKAMFVGLGILKPS